MLYNLSTYISNGWDALYLSTYISNGWDLGNGQLKKVRQWKNSREKEIIWSKIEQSMNAPKGVLKCDNWCISTQELDFSQLEGTCLVQCKGV